MTSAIPCDALPTELWSHTLGARPINRSSKTTAVQRYELFHIYFTSNISEFEKSYWKSVLFIKRGKIYGQSQTLKSQPNATLACDDLFFAFAPICTRQESRKKHFRTGTLAYVNPTSTFLVTWGKIVPAKPFQLIHVDALFTDSKGSRKYLSSLTWRSVFLPQKRDKTACTSKATWSISDGQPLWLSSCIFRRTARAHDAWCPNDHEREKMAGTQQPNTSKSRAVREVFVTTSDTKTK